MAIVSVRYIVDDVDMAIESQTKLTEPARVRYFIDDARAAVDFYTNHAGFAADGVIGITNGRARAIVAAVVGLISLVIGGLALARIRRSHRHRDRASRGHRGSGAGVDRHDPQCGASGHLHRWFRHGQRASRSNRGPGIGADRHEPRWAGPRPLPPFPQHRLTRP